VIKRYFIINGGFIVGGPYLWDGVSDWDPPLSGQVVTEAAAAGVPIAPAGQVIGEVQSSDQLASLVAGLQTQLTSLVATYDSVIDTAARDRASVRSRVEALEALGLGVRVGALEGAQPALAARVQALESLAMASRLNTMDIAIGQLRTDMVAADTAAAGRLTTLEAANAAARLAALESLNTSSRLATLEALNAAARLGALEALNAGARLAALEAKTVRLAAGVVPALIALGSNLDVTVTWPTPMPSATYAIDLLRGESLLGKATIALKSQTANGCTVTVTAGLLAVSVNSSFVALARN